MNLKTLADYNKKHQEKKKQQNKVALPSKKCLMCGYHFSFNAKKFYCCNINSIVCILCMSRKCNSCQKQRLRQLPNQQCNRCLKPYSIDVLFCEKKCQKYYCAACMSSFYSSRLKSLKSKSNQAFYCGHEIFAQDALKFMQNFCIGCGALNNTLNKISLVEHLKLCDNCFKFDYKKYDQLFYKCVNCSGVLKEYDQNQSIHNIIICDVCIQQQRKMESSFSNVDQKKQQSNQLKSIKKQKNNKVLDNQFLEDRINKEEKNNQQKSIEINQLKKQLFELSQENKELRERNKIQEQKISEYKKLFSSNYQLTQCKICLSGDSNIINEVCRHVGMCERCYENYKIKMNNSEFGCPVCKTVGKYSKYLKPIFV